MNIHEKHSEGAQPMPVLELMNLMPGISQGLNLRGDRSLASGGLRGA
jgi:hypothetical protein